MLDLDNGAPVSYQMMVEGRTRRSRHFVRIPWESDVLVYQAYLDKLFSEVLELDDPYGLRDYPKYEDAVLGRTYLMNMNSVPKRTISWRAS